MRFSSLLPACLSAAFLLAACHKSPPPKTGKAKRDESSARQSQEREAVETFASAIHAVVEWRHGQPPALNQAAHANAVQEFCKRLEPVPVKDLPPEIVAAWNDLQKASQQLATALSSSTPPAPAELKKLGDLGKKAGETLNQWLDAQGFGELRF